MGADEKGGASFEMRHRISKRPRKLKAGEIAFELPASMLEKRHELALIVSWITRRQLFGYSYSGLQPDYFFKMPEDSGVYVRLIIKTSRLTKSITMPGDVDVLVIPYEKDELILHRTLAIEIKALRATFANQGKSPNEFGFSQAKGLQRAGFPYVALGHLIVSDTSPETAWRQIGMARVIDSDGRVEMLPSKKIDWMPSDVTQRAFGRLSNSATDDNIGLLAAYIALSDEDKIGPPKPTPLWLPDCKRAALNPFIDQALLTRIAQLFDHEPGLFFDNPRFDPPNPETEY